MYTYIPIRLKDPVEVPSSYPMIFHFHWFIS